jgi:hypothetical protein
VKDAPYDEPEFSDGLLMLFGLIVVIGLLTAGFLLFNQHFAPQPEPTVPPAVGPEFYDDTPSP